VRKLSAALLLFLVATSPQIASAEWRVLSASNEVSSAPGLMYQHVDLTESETGERAFVDLALFSTKSCKLRVIDNPDGANNLNAAMRRANCLAGVNGGYFDPDFAPLGLRIVDGKVASRLTRGRLMSGVVASDNVTQVFRVGEFSLRRKWNAAVECGPFLVDLARPIRGLEATRSARRTFAAIGFGDRAALGYCPGATLADLGKILATPLGDFKIQRALNLDGGSSSAFYFKGERGLAVYPGEKTVRDFIGIVPR
jgi:phosphodiester glycosidase